jgi:predicted ATPase
MSHPFGDLLSQYRARKHGLTLARLANLAGYDKAVFVRMGQGQKDLTGPSGRERVVRIIGVLRDEGVLTTLDEANALLKAAGMPPLYPDYPDEATLMQRLEEGGPPVTFGELLKYLRRRAGLTQRELGIAVGYSETYITRLEGNVRRPDVTAVRAQFIPALDLTGEPALARRLIDLAQAASSNGKARGDDGLSAASHPDSAPGHLPASLTRFIGRDHEQAEVVRLLGANRLITLTGAGGVGKTRLAIEAGMAARSRFEGGVWFIPLAPVVDPALAARAVADAFGLSEQPGRSQLDAVSAHIADQHMLLILDNCEHLIHACAELVEGLLRACPRLHILATSREWLNVGGEVAWRVPSLALHETRQLFLDRARMARPDFCITGQNTAAVDSICAQLDGIPLAVELAAARLNGLSAEQLAAHLGDRFRLLTGGSRTALPRQQTLRATIDWSYELLSEPERRLLRWLSVFVGGWTAEAAERVCACPEGCDVLSLLLNLVDKSLVLVDDSLGETRYRILEMIRQYAWEHQVACDEAQAAHQRHARYCLALVQDDAPAEMRQAGAGVHFGYITGVQPWLSHLDRERDNLRAALAWCLREARDRADVETGVQLALWLSAYWDMRGPRPEGRAWLESALACTDAGLPTPARARLLVALATHYRFMGEDERAESCAREALAICRTLGDRLGTVMALRRLSEQARVSLEESRALIEEWISIARDLGDMTLTGSGLWYLGINRKLAGDLAYAAELYDECLRVLPAHEEGSIHIAKYYQGELMWLRFGGEHGLAQVHEALAHFRKTGFVLGVMIVLLWLGERALSQQDVPSARRYLNECLSVAYRDGAWGMFVSCVSLLAVAEAVAGQAARAVTLMSAAQRLNASALSALSADQQEPLTAARSQLNPRVLAASVAAGDAMSYDQALAFALQEGKADESPAEWPAIEVLSSGDIHPW